jgi:hypothetical protein
MCMLVELLYMLLVVGAIIHVLAIAITLRASCGPPPPLHLKVKALVAEVMDPLQESWSQFGMRLKGGISHTPRLTPL